MGAARQARAFSGVIYPESAPPDYARILEEMHVPLAWVLHDQDEGQKDHVHIVFYFPGKKTLQAVQELMKPLGSGLVQVAESLGTMTRYLMHLDDPHKHQYAREEVHAVGGFPVEELLVPVGNPGPEIRAFIAEQGIVSYWDLQRYCDVERPDWSTFVENHPSHFGRLLQAFREKERR